MKTPEAMSRTALTVSQARKVGSSVGVSGMPKPAAPCGARKASTPMRTQPAPISPASTVATVVSMDGVPSVTAAGG